jgi:hypothetical protein
MTLNDQTKYTNSVPLTVGSAQPAAKVQGAPTTEKNTEKLLAWTALNQYLPPRSADYDFWWQLTGRHVALQVEAAGYPIEKQYEALLFHYHWAVRLAAHPSALSAPNP